MIGTPDPARWTEQVPERLVTPRRRVGRQGRVVQDHGRAGGNGAPRVMPDGETLAPLVKAPTEKIGRNEPCWCGSGKKFKLCHGAA